MTRLSGVFRLKGGDEDFSDASLVGLKLFTVGLKVTVLCGFGRGREAEVSFSGTSWEESRGALSETEIEDMLS